MRCGYATRLARAALDRNDITVLPGMEINCLPAPHYADAIHVLAVFPPEAGEVAIERIFAGKSLAEPGDRTGKEAVRFDDLGGLRSRIHEEAESSCSRTSRTRSEVIARASDRPGEDVSPLHGGQAARARLSRTNTASTSQSCSRTPRYTQMLWMGLRTKAAYLPG